MKGNDQVLRHLNELLAYELAAMDQYFVHSEMYADWGLQRLAERIAHEFEDEKGHAQTLIARILFLEGTPDMVTREGLSIGHDVPSMLQSDLNVELAVAKALASAIAVCEQVGDYVTRDLLVVLQQDTEMDHAHWLEQQLRLIQQLGLPLYLQAQLSKAKGK